MRIQSQFRLNRHFEFPVLVLQGFHWCLFYQAKNILLVLGHKVKEVSKEIEYYVITLKKLEAPLVSYEVEVEKDGKEVEVEFAPDGSVLKDDEENED